MNALNQVKAHFAHCNDTLVLEVPDIQVAIEEISAGMDGECDYCELDNGTIDMWGEDSKIGAFRVKLIAE